MLLKEKQINIKEKNKTTSEHSKKHDTKEWISNNINNNVDINVTNIIYFPYNDTIIAHYKCLRKGRKEENMFDNQQQDTNIFEHTLKCCSKQNSVSINKPKQAFNCELIIIK